MTSTRLILLTGATGYIGGRLVPRLLKAGYDVRCLARDPARLEGRDWLPRVQVVAGDCLRPDTLTVALEGVHAALYLVHSMAGGRDFEERDVIAARNFAAAARTAGVDQPPFPRPPVRPIGSFRGLLAVQGPPAETKLLAAEARADGHAVVLARHTSPTSQSLRPFAASAPLR